MRGAGDAVTAIDADHVKCSTVGPTKPALITGATKTGDPLGDDALDYLLMPIHLVRWLQCRCLSY